MKTITTALFLIITVAASGQFYSGKEPKYIFKTKDSIIEYNSKIYYVHYAKPIYYIKVSDTIVVLDSLKFNALIKYVHKQ